MACCMHTIIPEVYKKRVDYPSGQKNELLAVDNVEPEHGVPRHLLVLFHRLLLPGKKKKGGPVRRSHHFHNNRRERRETRDRPAKSLH